MKHRRTGREPAWFWYLPRLKQTAQLAPDAYPLIRVGRTLVQGPTWGCLESNGLPFIANHIDRRVGRIDVELAERPPSGLEMTVTIGYSVILLARSWLPEIEDLIDDSRLFIGEVRVQGQLLDDWVTLNERWAPVLFGSEGRGKWCDRCGHLHMGLWGHIYFAEPDIAGRALMANEHGLFVRDDIVLDRKLRRPVGTHRPGRVRLQPTPKPSHSSPN